MPPSKGDTDTSSAVLVGAADVDIQQPQTIKSESGPQSEYAYQRDYRFWPGKQLYVWVTNIFFLATSVVQPFTGQLAGLFGRRHVALCIVALYTLGSGLAGGANGGAMLIAGRAVQGAGSGGMTAIMGIVICNLVPLRLRSSYQAILAMTYAVGMAIGPVVGGAIMQHTTWRWVFYINLPNKETKTWDKLKRIDVAGNFILVASTVSVLIALTWAGSVYPWSSYYVLIPLIIGLARLILPINLIAVPGAAIGAVALTKWGRYKLLHNIGFALLTAGVGSYTVLTRRSSTAEWVCLQILPAIGAGMVLDTLLPASQADVEESVIGRVEDSILRWGQP
ncbi:hypothetical protein PG994_008014 [Apiospora phragmitis]|uniref:Major facilitator superfamily (MFS) profile domain-containing protein n=1 Tax=Apiospora phragmitis TaxID=2905665 RepID=A0ABR1URT9_9PEZI